MQYEETLGITLSKTFKKKNILFKQAKLLCKQKIILKNHQNEK